MNAGVETVRFGWTGYERRVPQDARLCLNRSRSSLGVGVAFRSGCSVPVGARALIGREFNLSPLTPE